MRYMIIYIVLISTVVAKIQINLNSCYGNSKKIIIDGIVFYGLNIAKVKKDDSKFTNIKRKLKETIFNKAKENKDITIFIDKFKYKTKSDDEGFFEFSAVTKKPYFNSKTKIKAIYNQVEATCKPYIVKNSAKIGVISDFDDTIIKSDVTKNIKLLKNSFLLNYKQREVIKSTKRLINKILKDKYSPFFVVSGSPKQFNNSIYKFLDYYHFPKRIVILKKYKGKNADSIFNQFNYKISVIERLFKLYPNIKWYLIGDSGERDIEVYKTLLKRYSNRVKGIYIRDIKSGKIDKIY